MIQIKQEAKIEMSIAQLHRPNLGHATPAGKSDAEFVRDARHRRREPSICGQQKYVLTTASELC
jgi:hypothetical protein